MEKQLETEAINRVIQQIGFTDSISDGYHTFGELYDFRKIYNALLFNEWAKQGKYEVHKSMRHNDGEKCFENDTWFIVSAMLPSGQVSNHYHIHDWDLFQIPIVEKALFSWDSHTSKDVLERLTKTAKMKTNG
jgi:hypothetical protein